MPACNLQVGVKIKSMVRKSSNGKEKTQEPVAQDDMRSHCVFANALDIFGDKWTLLVVRDLFFFDKHEYKDFLGSPEGIATNILADRLKKLVSYGIAAEMPHPDSRARKLYYLTQKGKDLLPVLLSIARWGSDYLPELSIMRPLYERVKADPRKLEKDVLRKLALWERDNLGE